MQWLILYVNLTGLQSTGHFVTQCFEFICKGFWMRFVFELVDRVKHVALPTEGGRQPTHWRPKENKKQKEIEFLSLPDCWAETTVFSDWDLDPQVFPVLTFGLSVEFTPLAFLGFQLADSRSWDLLASIIMGNQFFFRNHVCVYICIFCLSGEPYLHVADAQ